MAPSSYSNHFYRKNNTEPYNERGSFILKAMITEKVPKGIVHVCFGWWNSIHKVNVNLLIGEYVSDIGHGAAFHNCLVDIQKLS
jgi:anaerobic selenocysteine-containing dehydrogenase